MPYADPWGLLNGIFYEIMKTYKVYWFFTHKKPKGAKTTGENTIEALSEAAARKDYHKIYPHQTIEKVEELCP